MILVVNTAVSMVAISVVNDRVRLLVVTDWDAGSSLEARPPVLDAAPGDSYVTEVVAASAVTIYEVIVEGFALVQISVGATTAQATIETIGSRRLYRLEDPLSVSLNETIRIHLCNDTEVSLKQKDVTIVRYDPTARPPPVPYRRERVNVTPSPAEDRVIMIEGADNRCGICGELFEISPSDPHWSTGHGPLCPKRASS